MICGIFTHQGDNLPVAYSKLGRSRFSLPGLPWTSAASAETLTIRTRDLDVVSAAVRSRMGRRDLVRRKGARWFVCQVVSKPSSVSLKGAFMTWKVHFY